jgi:hypothetical protein
MVSEQNLSQPESHHCLVKVSLLLFKAKSVVMTISSVVPTRTHENLSFYNFFG